MLRRTIGYVFHRRPAGSGREPARIEPVVYRGIGLLNSPKRLVRDPACGIRASLFTYRIVIAERWNRGSHAGPEDSQQPRSGQPAVVIQTDASCAVFFVMAGASTSIWKKSAFGVAVDSTARSSGQ